MQHTGDVLQNVILETYIISLTNVTPMHLIKKELLTWQFYILELFKTKVEGVGKYVCVTMFLNILFINVKN